MAVPACLLAASLLATACPADAARLQRIDLQPDSIVLHFDDAATSASAFLLDGPERLAVDLQGVDPARASPALAPVGSVGAVRQGRIDAHATRLVFDLAQPAVIGDGDFAEDGRALTIKLKPVSAERFARRANGARTRFAPPIAFDHDAQAAPPTAPATDDAPDAAPARVRVAGRAGRPLVVIDAGHGGKDPGSPGVDGVHKEKDVALEIARAIRDELVASGRVRVAMTRDDDHFVLLDDRREIARRLGADLFISVHADSSPSGPSAHGATIYTLSEVSSDRVAARLAAKENKADAVAGVDFAGQPNDVSSILIDLAQRETMNASAVFANLLQRELSPMIQFTQAYHRFAGLVVLKAPDVPSVLLETGYMSNPEDLKLLFSQDYQHRIAIGVRNAVEAHFARRLHLETADSQ